MKKSRDKNPVLYWPICYFNKISLSPQARKVVGSEDNIHEYSMSTISIPRSGER